MRLDVYLCENKLMKSRTYANVAIKEGRILVNGKAVLKPSYDISDEQVEVIPKEKEYVSRGGYKLDSALDEFNIAVEEKYVVDIGASTGGFSDVCLSRKALKVYAVDVGTMQLDESLKQNPKLISMENTNALDLSKNDISDKIDLVVMDVSFVSIKTLLPHLIALFDESEFVVLIKPQFEAGKKYIGKNGILKDKKVHIQILEDIYYFLTSQNCFIHKMTTSKTKGKDGNQEYFVYFSKQSHKTEFNLTRIKDIVR